MDALVGDSMEVVPEFGRNDLAHMDDIDIDLDIAQNDNNQYDNDLMLDDASVTASNRPSGDGEFDEDMVDGDDYAPVNEQDQNSAFWGNQITGPISEDVQIGMDDQEESVEDIDVPVSEAPVEQDEHIVEESESAIQDHAIENPRSTDQDPTIEHSESVVQDQAIETSESAVQHQNIESNESGSNVATEDKNRSPQEEVTQEELREKTLASTENFASGNGDAQVTGDEGNALPDTETALQNEPEYARVECGKQPSLPTVDRKSPEGTISRHQEETEEGDHASQGEEHVASAHSHENDHQEAQEDHHQFNIEESVPLQAIKVLYQDNEMSLFPPAEDDPTETFLLQDVNLADEPIGKLLHACREVLGDHIGPDDELLLDIESLGLYFSDTRGHPYNISLSQIVSTYLNLCANDRIDNPEPIYTSLYFRPSAEAQFSYLTDEVSNGKGLSQVQLWEEDGSGTDGEKTTEEPSREGSDIDPVQSKEDSNEEPKPFGASHLLPAPKNEDEKQEHHTNDTNEVEDQHPSHVAEKHEDNEDGQQETDDAHASEAPYIEQANHLIETSGETNNETESETVQEDTAESTEIPVASVSQDSQTDANENQPIPFEENLEEPRFEDEHSEQRPPKEPTLDEKPDETKPSNDVTYEGHDDIINLDFDPSDVNVPADEKAPTVPEDSYEDVNNGDDAAEANEPAPGPEGHDQPTAIDKEDETLNIGSAPQTYIHARELTPNDDDDDDKEDISNLQKGFQHIADANSPDNEPIDGKEKVLDGTANDTTETSLPSSLAIETPNGDHDIPRTRDVDEDVLACEPTELETPSSSKRSREDENHDEARSTPYLKRVRSS